MRKEFLIIVLFLLISYVAFAKDDIAKETDTSIKITTTTTQIVALKNLKEQRKILSDQLSMFDSQVLKKRQEIVDQIARFDDIITESEKQGVKELVEQAKE